MPTKRKAEKESATPPSKSAKTTGSGEPPTPTKPVLGAAQAQHMVNIHKALKAIGNHPLFTDLQNAKPLPIGQGGMEQPYCQRHCNTILPDWDEAAEIVEYCCGGNFMWLCHTWLCNYRVPVNPGQITYIQKTKFPAHNPPASAPCRTKVAIADGEAAWTPGSLQRLSPEEHGHAALLSLQEAIESNAEDAILQRWKRLLLTWPMSFERIPEGDARMWRAQNLRQQMIDLGETVKQTVRQRVVDVALYKQEKEIELQSSVSSEKMAQLYKANLKLARSSEILSPSFIDGAVTIYKRVLSNDVCNRLLEWCDENFLGNETHPFSSIYSLLALCERGHTPQRIAYALEILIDHYRLEFIDLGHFTVKRMKDLKDSYVKLEVITSSLTLTNTSLAHGSTLWTSLPKLKRSAVAS
jgi:hypothetical protein